MIALFRSLPEIHDHMWKWGQNLLWKLRALPFLTILVDDNRIVQSSHYCTSLAYSGTQFFVLLSVTRECNPKILELFYLLQYQYLFTKNATIRSGRNRERPKWSPSLLNLCETYWQCEKWQQTPAIIRCRKNKVLMIAISWKQCDL